MPGKTSGRPLRAACAVVYAVTGLACAAGLAGCGGPQVTSTVPAPPPASTQLGTVGGLVRLGDDLRRQGDDDGALVIYQAASSRDPKDVPALSRIGAVSVALGEPVRAEQAFRAVLAQDGRDVGAQFGLGVALLARHKVDEALHVLAPLAQGSADVRHLRAYGVTLDMAGRAAEAQATYRRGLALAPTDSDLHGNLALSLAAGGDNAAALAESEAAVESVVPNPRQRANNVLLLVLAGQDGEARRRGLAWFGPGQTNAVMQQAALVRHAPDAQSRAAALGLMTQASAQ